MEDRADSARERIACLTITAPFVGMALVVVIALAWGSEEAGWFGVVVPVFAISAIASGMMLAPRGDFAGGVLMGLAMGPLALPVAFALARHRRGRIATPSPPTAESPPEEDGAPGQGAAP